MIRCKDVLMLKKFLQSLKLVIDGKECSAVVDLSNFFLEKVKKPKTKVVVKCMKKYPVKEGFPSTTEVLQLTNLLIKSLDDKIVKLNNLQILDLSDNKLTCLPHEVKNLGLQELYIGNNQLGKTPSSEWLWLKDGKIVETLCLLDLSSNQVNLKNNFLILLSFYKFLIKKILF